ncbi:hypothetical protein Adt_24417 [Abeliophyllum distichum]|uniref:Uncharacterized protein n=1 Tax=Abeliophyllum distichum TaxID=126358 RepID=A0ABD1SDP4_9LAMI
MSRSTEYESLFSPLPIPGGDGTLVLPTVAPNLFSVVLDSVEDRGSWMASTKPRIRVVASRTKKIVIRIQNSCCSLEESCVTVSASLLNVYDGKMVDERTHGVRRGSDMKEVLVDILGDPFIYMQSCWVSQKELEYEVEGLFGCELFQMPHIRNISVKEMARIAVDFKSRIAAFPDVDPREIRREVMGNYIVSMPNSKMKKLLFEMFYYIN